jgi:hypothetical protein
MSRYDAMQAIQKLEKQPAILAGLAKNYREKAAKINADDNLSDTGRARKIEEVRNKAVNDLSNIQRDISANQAAARENLESEIARPGIEGVEGELRHNRLWNRVQAQIANGHTINGIIQNADRATLDAIREEAPYFYPNEAGGIEKLASHYDRALMGNDESRAHDQLEELTSGSHRLDMAVSQVESEINGDGTATFIPAYHADQQGHDVSPAPDAAA